MKQLWSMDKSIENIGLVNLIQHLQTVLNIVSIAIENGLIATTASFGLKIKMEIGIVIGERKGAINVELIITLIWDMEILKFQLLTGLVEYVT